jgi:hypothetical protein
MRQFDSVFHENVEMMFSQRSYLPPVFGAANGRGAGAQGQGEAAERNRRGKGIKLSQARLTAMRSPPHSDFSTHIIFLPLSK